MQFSQNDGINKCMVTIAMYIAKLPHFNGIMIAVATYPYV